MKRGAVSGILCGVGVAACVYSLKSTTDPRMCIISLAGALLFGIGSMGLAVGAWED